MRRAFFFIPILALACLLLGACATPDAPILVFAAASTRDALDEVLADWEGSPVSVSYAASSTLARQIEAGAPAHLFLSAHPRWMDHVAQRGLIDEDSRHTLLANGLVLIVPRDAASPTRTVPIAEVNPAAVLGDGVFAMGDPDHVPAGIYGRTALEALGWWDGLQANIARAFDTRAALAFVERGEAPLGLVYATDAASSARVDVLAVIPAALHPPISYPIALVRGATHPEARALLDHLASPAAAAVFARHGFREP